MATSPPKWTATAGTARAAPLLDAGALRPVYQPVLELATGSVVGYEALARGMTDGELRSPAALFAAARAADELIELDSACLQAAIRDATATALAAPFTLFLNAEPATFERPLPDTGPSLRCVVEFTDRALTLSPASVLATLERIRAAGWGVALDAVGADPRTLALVSLLQPDVIKLDVSRIRAGGPEHVAVVAASVGLERERSGATLLAKGIESDADLRAAESCGATLGQGFHLGRPEALPQPLPAPGKPVPFIAAGAGPWGSTPWRRVTNLRRPRSASVDTVGAVAAQLEQQAAALGTACGLLEIQPSLAVQAIGRAASERSGRVEDRAGMLRVLPPATVGDDLAGTWTVVAFGPFFAAVLVARPDGDGDGWRYALSYDRRTAVECALMLASRLEPLR